MEYAQKMVLVPEGSVRLLEKRNNEMIAPVTNSMVSLKDDMKETLFDPLLPDDQKAAFYAQLLQRYLAYKDKRTRDIQAPVSVKIADSAEQDKSLKNISKVSESEPKSNEDVTTNAMTSEILRNVPKTLKRRASHLLSRIQNHPEIINWNSKGELIHEGQTLTGTNIVDLFGDVLRERRNFNPPGADVFVHGLSRMNTPQEYIGNTARRNTMMKYLKDPKQQPDFHTATSGSNRTTPYRVPRRQPIISSPARRRTDSKLTKKWLTL